MRTSLFTFSLFIIVSCNNTSPNYDFNDSQIGVDIIGPRIAKVTPKFIRTGDHYYYLLSNPKLDIYSKKELLDSIMLPAWVQLKDPNEITNLGYEKTYRIYVSSANPSRSDSLDINIHYRSFYMSVE